jgi:hypothetical protein
MDKGSVDILAKLIADGSSGPFPFFTTLSDGAEYIYSVRMYPFDVLDKAKVTEQLYNGIVDGIGTGDLLDPNNENASMLKCINLGQYIAYNPKPASTYPIISETIDGIYKTMCGAVINNEYNSILNVGDMVVPRYFNNFLDYAPYTKIELYLPFYGMVDIDVNLCMGETIYIQYIIDFSNGTATAVISTNTKLIKDVTFKIAVDIPIEQTNASDMRRDNTMMLLSTAIGIGGAVATGGTSALASGMLATAGLNTLNTLSKNREHLVKGAEMGGVSGWYGPTKPFIVITRAIPKENELYNELYGKPSQSAVLLSDEINNGSFFIVDDVHLEGFTTASSKELEEIERLLKTGVIG